MHKQVDRVSGLWRLLMILCVTAALCLVACDDGGTTTDGDEDTAVDGDIIDPDPDTDDADVADPDELEGDDEDLEDADPVDEDEIPDTEDTTEDPDIDPDESGPYVYPDPGPIDNNRAIDMPADALICLNDDMSTLATLSVMGLPGLDPVQNNIRQLPADSDMAVLGQQVFTWRYSDENTYFEVWEADDGMSRSAQYGLGWNKPLEGMLLVNPFKGYAAFEEFQSLLVFNPQSGSAYTVRQLDEDVSNIADIRGIGLLPAAGAAVVIVRTTDSAAGAIWIDTATDSVHPAQPMEGDMAVPIPLGDATQGAVTVAAIEAVGDQGLMIALDRAIVFLPAPNSMQQPVLVANFSDLNGSSVVDFLPDSPTSGWLLISRDIDALLYAYRDDSGFSWEEEAVFDEGVVADLHRSPVTGSVYCAASHDSDGNPGGVFTLSRSNGKTITEPVFTGWIPRKLATVTDGGIVTDGDIDTEIDDEPELPDSEEIDDQDIEPEPEPEPDTDNIVDSLPANIPDNNSAGIIYEIEVSEACPADAVDISVTLVHPEIGDIRITAQRPDGEEIMVFDRAGDGPGLQISRRFAIDPAADLSGVWQLYVADLAPADTGSLQAASITPRCAALPDGDLDDDIAEQEETGPVSFDGLHLPALVFATAQDDSGQLTALPTTPPMPAFVADNNLNPVAALWARGNELLVLEGRGADRLTLRDGGNDLSVSSTISVGDGNLDANALVVTDNNTAFVSRFGSNEILVIDLANGQSLGSVDLSAFADQVDSGAEPVALHLSGDRLFVLLQHLDTTNDLRIPAGYGSIAVIDTTDLTVIDTDTELEGVQDILLGCAFPTTMQAIGNTLYVACVNSLGLQDSDAAGIETVDTETLQSNGLALTEADLGLGLLDIALGPHGSGLVLGVDGSFNTVVKTVDVPGATVGTAIDNPGGWAHTALKTNNMRHAFVLYGDANPGYRRWDLLRSVWIDDAILPLAQAPNDVVLLKATSPAGLLLVTDPETGAPAVSFSPRNGGGAFETPGTLYNNAQATTRLSISPWHVFMPDAAGDDMVDSYSATSGLRPLSRLRAGNGSLLVVDVEAAAADHAYVSRRGSQELLQFNPLTGTATGTVDLSGFADDIDGRAEPGAMAIAGDYLYVEISGLDATNDFAPSGNGRIALINAATGEVFDTDPVVPGVQGIRLPAPMPAGHLRIHNGLAFVTASGLTDGVDANAGLYAIDLSSSAVVSIVLETDLDAHMLDAALLSTERGVALVQSPEGDRSLITFTPDTGELEATIISPEDAMVYAIEPVFDEGLVLVATDSGVVAFDALAGQLILDLGPPTSDAVTALRLMPVTGNQCASDAMCDSGVCQIIPGLCGVDCTAGDGSLSGDDYCRSIDLSYICHAEAMGMCAPLCEVDETCQAFDEALICGEDGYCIEPPPIDGDEELEDELEAEIEADTEIEAEIPDGDISEDEAEVELEAEIEAETEIEAEVPDGDISEDEAEVELEAEIEAETELEAEIPDGDISEDEAEVELEAEIEVETEIEAEIPDGDIGEDEAEVELEAEIEAEIEAEVELEAEIELEAEVELEAEIEVEVEVEVELEAEIELEAEVEIELEPEVEIPLRR